jgi:S1-C subfamily serine protease
MALLLVIGGGTALAGPSSEVLDVADPPVQAQPGQEKEPHRAADLASIERRVQAVYEQVMARPGRQPWVQETQIVRRAQTLPRRDEWDCQLETLGVWPSISGASGGEVFDLEGRVVGVLLGRTIAVRSAQPEARHARVELHRKEWDLLAAAKPVDVLDSDPLTEITAAFDRIAKDLPPVAVEVLGDGKPRTLGTIVGSDGRILTKASELVGAVSCRLADGRVFPASVEKVPREHDLALLKIDADGLPEARWSRDESIAPGTLIAALAPGQPPRAGVVSLAARPIPRVTGELGVFLRDGDHGLEVRDVVADEDDVPLRKGDVVLHVDGQPTPDLDAYHALMKPESGATIPYAGDPVRVGVRRGGDTLELNFTRPPSNSLLQMYGTRTASRRWWGFPSVFGTDIQLTPKLCGGPVIDRSGRVAGIAIACRSIRSPDKGECHVIPAHVARGVVADD